MRTTMLFRRSIEAEGIPILASADGRRGVRPRRGVGIPQRETQPGPPYFAMTFIANPTMPFHG
jgi:hypothetical protein